MNCETAGKQLSLLLYGELSFDEEELLEQHLEGCGECRAAWEREQALHRAMATASLEPGEMLLARCRAELRGRLAEEPAPGPPRRGFWRGLASWMVPSWLPGPAILRPAGALALVAIGFLAARLSVPGGSGGGRLASDSDPVLRRVRLVEAQPAGNIRIVLDETRQRVLSGSVEDEAVRGLLLAAAKDPGDPGLRAESVDLLGTRPERAEVREALLAALQYDTNPGVRLKAIEGLKSFAQDSQARRVLSQVLLTDNNPGVRAQAIDLLTQSREHEVVPVLQQLMRQEENNYIRLRGQKALREMNASVETY